MERASPGGSVTIGGKDWLWLGLMLAGALALGLHGILHYGYIGQDYVLHRNVLLSYPASFTYALTNPPGLYWLGWVIRTWISQTYCLELLALVSLILNTAALAVLYALIWRAISSRSLRLAAAALITFVPFRVIHSVVIASDAFSIPVFAAAAWCMVRLTDGDRSRLHCLLLGLVLTLGMLLKYTVVGLLPPAAVVLALTLWKHPPAAGRRSLALIGAAALALPMAVFLWQMDQSNRVMGMTTYGHWRIPTEPVVMRWQDILLLKSSDRKLFAAPEYFRDELFGHRAYSYAGLLHVTSFTDSQNYFQKVPEGLATGLRDRNQGDLVRHRTPLSHRLQVLAVSGTLPLSLLALAGTLAGGLAFLPSLIFGRGGLNPSAAILTGAALAVYAPIFFSFTRLGDPYTPGYWLPRLVMPSLLVFLCLGLVLLDVLLRRLGRWPQLQVLLPRLFLTHVLVACGLFVGFLA